MQLLTNGSFSLVERITGLRALLFLVAIALYTDIFVSNIYHESIFSITNNWHQDKVSLGDGLYYLIGISLLYGAIAPFIIYLGDPILASRELKNKSFQESKQLKMPLSDIREFAITENNNAAYQYYQEQNNKLEHFKVLRKHSIVIVLLFLVSLVTYHTGIPGDNSILSSSFQRLSEEGAWVAMLRILVGGIGIYIFFTAWMTEQFYEVLYLSPRASHFEKRKEREWLAELTTGLIEMKTMNEHLRSVIDAISEFHPNTDAAKESIKYCQRHGLLKPDKNELTAKGRFFSKYL